jgi:hypothetical protein
MEFSLYGSPLNKIIAPNAEALNMQQTLNGDPWVGIYYLSSNVSSGNIKAILKVTTPYIKEFMGVPMSNIKQTP